MIHTYFAQQILARTEVNILHSHLTTLCENWNKYPKTFRKEIFSWKWREYIRPQKCVLIICCIMDIGSVTFKIWQEFIYIGLLEVACSCISGTLTIWPIFQFYLRIRTIIFLEFHQGKSVCLLNCKCYSLPGSNYHQQIRPEEQNAVEQPGRMWSKDIFGSEISRYIGCFDMVRFTDPRRFQ